MRILHISSAKNFGGGERHFVDLCRGLTAKGHEVFAVLRPTNEWQERLNFLPDKNIFHSSIRNSFGIFSAKRIANFINRNEIDVIHAHVARDYIPASLACRISKNAKFVLTRHVLFPMKPFHRYALTNVEKAIAVSSSVEANLQKIFPKQKISVIPNGIEIKFNPADQQKLSEAFRIFHKIPFDAPLIGTVGELKVLKGQRDFILAANEVVKKFPEAYFVIVGKDNGVNKPFRRELKRLVKVFDLEKQFLFLDWIEDMSELLAALDIFVSASHSESFGLAILEAMSNETAIVATETEGAKELLQKGESGLLVQIKNPLEIAKAIETILENPQKRESFGKNARNFAQNNFSLDKMIDQTELLYRELL